MYYYNINGATLVSLTPLEGFGPQVEPAQCWRLFAAVPGDPVLGRGSFKVTHPGQLTGAGHGLEALDASRLPQVQADERIARAIEDGRVTAVNISRPGWEKLIRWSPSAEIGRASCRERVSA